MKKPYLLIASAAVIIAAGFSVNKFALHNKVTSPANTPVSAQVKQPKTISTATPTNTNAALSTVVAGMNTVIANYPDFSAAASLVDLDSGTQYDAGAVGTLFKAASTAKVLAAVDYLHEVEQGNAALDQNIDGVPAEQLIQQMIEVSDNTAWSDIDYYLGDQQQDYARSIGMSSFTGGDYNTMTASDEAKLLTQLYQGKLINAADASLLYSYMQNSDGDNLVKDALPAGAVVYHKYGQLWGYLNDATIVSYQGHNFVLVVFTNNPDGTTDDYANQVALIHAIAVAAFNDITANG